LLLDTGEVTATGVRRRGGGLDAVWALSWPEQQATGLNPIIIRAVYSAGAHHPHLQGGTVGDWPLNVFDEERAIPGGALVLIDGGRISEIEPASVDLPDGWPVVEVPGATLLPGLIDTHVHLCGDSRTGALDRLPGYGDAELAGVIEHGRRGTSAGAGRDHGTHRHDLAGTPGSRRAHAPRRRATGLRR
jgi:hypothetical protein